MAARSSATKALAFTSTLHQGARWLACTQARPTRVVAAWRSGTNIAMLPAATPTYSMVRMPQDLASRIVDLLGPVPVLVDHAHWPPVAYMLTSPRIDSAWSRWGPPPYARILSAQTLIPVPEPGTPPPAVSASPVTWAIAPDGTGALMPPRPLYEVLHKLTSPPAEDQARDAQRRQVARGARQTWSVTHLTDPREAAALVAGFLHGRGVPGPTATAATQLAAHLTRATRHRRALLAAITHDRITVTVHAEDPATAEIRPALLNPLKSAADDWGRRPAARGGTLLWGALDV
ncbi:hypothetical protein [Streptomyces sp. NPDC002067]